MCQHSCHHRIYFISAWYQSALHKHLGSEKEICGACSEIRIQHFCVWTYFTFVYCFIPYLVHVIQPCKVWTIFQTCWPIKVLCYFPESISGKGWVTIKHLIWLIVNWFQIKSGSCWRQRRRKRMDHHFSQLNKLYFFWRLSCQVLACNNCISVPFSFFHCIASPYFKCNKYDFSCNLIVMIAYFLSFETVPILNVTSVTFHAICL